MSVHSLAIGHVIRVCQNPPSQVIISEHALSNTDTIVKLVVLFCPS